MPKQGIKKIFAGMLAMMIILPGLAISMPANAQGIDAGLNYGEAIGLGNRDPKSIIVGVIQVILGFLGLLAVIIILFGGFKWMMSRGDESEVESARKLIIAGIIGLLIVLAAWGISLWVIQIIAEQTGTDVGL